MAFTEPYFFFNLPQAGKGGLWLFPSLLFTMILCMRTKSVTIHSSVLLNFNNLKDIILLCHTLAVALPHVFVWHAVHSCKNVPFDVRIHHEC